MYFVLEVFSINMSFFIYDGKIENREVRNYDSDKIYDFVLYLKIDLLELRNIFLVFLIKNIKY